MSSKPLAEIGYISKKFSGVSSTYPDLLLPLSELIIFVSTKETTLCPSINGDVLSSVGAKYLPGTLVPNPVSVNVLYKSSPSILRMACSSLARRAASNSGFKLFINSVLCVPTIFAFGPTDIASLIDILASW